MTKAREIAELGQKLTVDASGNIDIAGNITSDGLTVDGTSVLNSETNFVPDTYSSNKSLVLASTGATGGSGQYGASLAFSRVNSDSPRAAIAAVNTDGNFERMGLSFWTHISNVGTDPMDRRMQIDHDGSIKFFELDGTTPSFLYHPTAGTVFNEAGNDRDFRIESSTHTHAFTVDASTSNIGFGVNTPANVLEINRSSTGVVAVEITNTHTTGAGSSRLILNNGSDTNSSGFQIINNADDGVVNLLNYKDTPLHLWQNAAIKQSIKTSETVFNDISADHDFRVESDSNALAFIVDGGLGNVGIGSNAHSEYKLRVADSTDAEVGILVENNGDTANATASIVLDAVGNNFRIVNYPDAGDEDNVTRFLSTAGGSSFKFATAAADRMTIHSNGRIDLNGPDYTYANPDANYHIALEENSHNAYISNINGTVFVMSGAKYYGGSLRTLDSTETAESSMSLSNDIGFSLYGSDGHTAGYQTAETQLHHRMETRTGAAIFNDAGLVTGDFRVESGANSHAFFIEADSSEIFMGTSAQADAGARLHVAVNGSVGIEVGHSTTFYGLWFAREGVQKGYTQTTASGTTYNTGSDARLKENVSTITDGIDVLNQMRAVEFDWIGEDDAPRTRGFIAQEMIGVAPESVSGDPDGEIMMGMDYGRITPVIVAALQEAITKIEALEAKVTALENA